MSSRLRTHALSLADLYGRQNWMTMSIKNAKSTIRFKTMTTRGGSCTNETCVLVGCVGAWVRARVREAWTGEQVSK